MVPDDPGRRSFFRQFARDLLVKADEVRGARYITYDELLNASEKKLGWLMPVIRSGITIIPSEGTVKALMPDGTEKLVFESSELSLLTFNSFNGRNTLAEVGRIVSAAMNLPADAGYRAARELFLKLVVSGVAESCRYWT